MLGKSVNSRSWHTFPKHKTFPSRQHKTGGICVREYGMTTQTRTTLKELSDASGEGSARRASRAHSKEFTRCFSLLTLEIFPPCFRSRKSGSASSLALVASEIEVSGLWEFEEVAGDPEGSGDKTTFVSTRPHAIHRNQRS